jgi:hypothetical protein
MAVSDRADPILAPLGAAVRRRMGELWHAGRPRSTGGARRSRARANGSEGPSSAAAGAAEMGRVRAAPHPGPSYKVAPEIPLAWPAHHFACQRRRAPRYASSS